MSQAVLAAIGMNELNLPPWIYGTAKCFSEDSCECCMNNSIVWQFYELYGQLYSAHALI